MSPSRNDGPPTTSMKVIIVGAGFAGLASAIECHRRGHSVIVFDSFPKFKPLGDIISFQPNAGRIFERWPGMKAQLDPICHVGKELTFKNYLGEYLFTQSLDNEKIFGKKYSGHRGEIHELVFNYARDLGIDIRLGQPIDNYEETDSNASVILPNGEKITGDLVLAADGVRSKGRTLVLGYEDKPKPSGYAIYRAWLDATEIAKNPLTKHLVENGDTFNAWVGPDQHFLATSIKGGKDFSWVCTHKDSADIRESWSSPGSIPDTARLVSTWDPVVRTIVSLTPSCLDWKLVYRDPLPTWISPRARIALIGDAAHPFLPTATQGGSQAMEDGVTIAVVLGLCGGREKVPEALRAYERIRYDRVRRAQKTGEETRESWHKMDWKGGQGRVEAEREKGALEPLKLRKEMWLLGHDAEAYAGDVYAETVRALREEREGGGQMGMGAQKGHVRECVEAGA